MADRVSAASAEIAASVSGTIARVSAAAVEVAATAGGASPRVSAATVEISAYAASASARISSLSIEYALGMLPPGVIIPPTGTLIDPASPTAVCCAGVWTAGAPAACSWTDGTPPVTPYTTPSC